MDQKIRISGTEYVITDELLRESVKFGLQSMVDQGMPKKTLESLLKHAKPIGEVVYIADKLGIPEEDYDEFFSWTRMHGIDGSIDYPFGGSTAPEIFGISPYRSAIDYYADKLGLPGANYAEEDDDGKELIFYAGHQIEPVLRKYFAYENKARYTVIESDLQFVSREYEHFLFNTDGFLIDNETDDFGILEIKHTMHTNIPAIKAFQNGELVPHFAHYDAQGRAYMEGVGAEFCCFFLGWGVRPNDTCTAQIRIERDEDIGDNLLSTCENFIEHNIKNCIPPTVNSVKNLSLKRKCLEQLYGKVDLSKGSVKIDKSLLGALDELIDAKNKITEAKKRKKEIEDEIKDLTEKYETAQIPFIEELKDAPKGVIEDKDGNRYFIKYEPKKEINLHELMKQYPDVYERVKKPAINTPLLKKVSMDAYNAVRMPAANGKRNFDVSGFAIDK